MPIAKAAEYGYLSAKCHVMKAQLLDGDKLKTLSASRSIGEFIGALSATPYAPYITDISLEGIQSGLQQAFTSRNKRLTRDLRSRQQEIFRLFFLEKYTLLEQKMAQRTAENEEKIFHQIDRDYIYRLKLGIAHFSTSEQRQFKKIIGSYFDLLNLYNLVKLRILYGLSVEETLSNMFPYSGKFPLSVLSELCRVKTIQELSGRLQPFLGRTFEDYETFRQVLYGYHRRTLLSVWVGYPFSLTLPFSLLRLIEMEISDLRAIAEGIVFGLDSEEIAVMTVVN